MSFFASWMIFVAGAGLLVPLWIAAPPPPTTARPLLLVENKAEHTLSIVDPEAGRELGKVTLSGVTGHEVAASPDGRFAYAPIYGDSGVGLPGSNGRTIDIVDIRRRRPVAEIDLGRPVRPHCAIVAPDGLLYVTAELADAVYVIDPRERKLIASIPTEQRESHMLAITRDGKRGYTANVGAGSVTVLDLENRKPVTVIHVCKVVQRISLSADDRLAFTADQEQARIAVIDTETNRLKSWIHLPGIGFGTRATPNGKWLLVTIPGQSKIAVIDLSTMRVSRTIGVPESPQEILIPAGGRVAYVSCDKRGEVAVLDLGTWRVQKLIRVGKDDDGMAWAE
jgi:DNA-binding beta-propeller fold protein YncE